MSSTKPLPPGSVIGILGGGQLGRMLALAAARLGLKSHIYCPDAASPAFDVSAAHICAPYEDEAALAEFASSVDVVTYEFENVPDVTADLLSARVPVHPDPKILAITQDRATEKEYLEAIGLEVARWAKISTGEDLERAVDRIGLPAILKTRRFGYDGKGQTGISSGDDLASAWDAIGNAPAVLEARVPLACEVSVIVARSGTGEIRAFDITENVHVDHILKTSTVPASIPGRLQEQALRMGQSIAEALRYVGVMGVELFVTGEGGDQQLLVNEIAPRVHNSGHWTQDACAVCQFEQHIRAVAGWPLGNPARHSDVVMTNLIGDEAGTWRDIATGAGACLHLYGKSETRAGRKMGHVNRLLPRK
ncbi:MAG: 5-(carboxyamino)imidazole ribonucleotide synthase [Pseudomonadota bacterium]